MTEPDVFIRLRVGGAFDPVEITRRLGLTPSATHEQGGVVGNGRSGRRYEHSGWFLDSSGHVTSGVIEPHLAWLLELLEPRASVLGELVAEGAQADVDCFWASVGMSGGPWISAESMRRLGALQLPLVISFYAIEGEE